MKTRSLRVTVGSVLVILGLSSCASSTSAVGAGPGAAGAAATASGTAGAALLAPLATDLWVTSAPAGMSAVYGRVVNDGDEALTLVSASSPLATTVELHRAAMAEGSPVMRPSRGGFVIPAQGVLELKPGGDHIMLMGLVAPVRAGDDVTLMLTSSSRTGIRVHAVARDFAGAQASYRPAGPVAGPVAGPGAHGDGERGGTPEIRAGAGVAERRDLVGPRA